MGSPVGLLCVPGRFDNLQGLLGCGAGARTGTFRLGGASGSAGGARRGALGAEVPLAFKSARGKTSRPLPRGRTSSPAPGPRAGSAHLAAREAHLED